MARLVAKAAVSQQQYDTAHDACVNLDATLALQQARIDKARRDVDLMRYEVGQYAIRAPLDGRVVRRMAQPGQGTSTLEVTDLFLILPETAQIIRTEVEERFAGLLHDDLEVLVTPQAGVGQERAGTIKRISHMMGARKNKELDPTDKTDVRVVEVIVMLEGPADSLLIGQRVIVRFNNRKSSRTEKARGSG